MVLLDKIWYSTPMGEKRVLRHSEKFNVEGIAIPFVWKISSGFFCYMKLRCLMQNEGNLCRLKMLA